MPLLGRAKRTKTPEELELAVACSDCMLQGFKYCVAGVAIGTIIGVRKKNLWPMATAGLVGSSMDFFDGYYNRCRPQLDAWDAAERKAIEREMEEAAAKLGNARPANSSTSNKKA